MSIKMNSASASVDKETLNNLKMTESLKKRIEDGDFSEEEKKKFSHNVDAISEKVEHILDNPYFNIEEALRFLPRKGGIRDDMKKISLSAIEAQGLKISKSKT